MRPFVLMDVGARWGVDERWRSLGDDVRIFGFEPDVAECERLNAVVDGKAPAVTYVPMALGDRPGPAIIHVTSEPACSSLFPPRTDLSRPFPELACMTPTGTEDVMVTTLDLWCSSNGMEHVDLIKLDAQGGELAILTGAEHILETTLFLEIEVEFNPLYEGQPLFGEIDAFVRRRGFQLWRLDNLVHHSPHGSRGQRTRFRTFHDSVPTETTVDDGQLYWAHAHYVRSTLAPDAARPPESDERIRAGRLAEALGFLSLANHLRRSD